MAEERDIRDPLVPVSDDAQAGPVAHRVAAQLLQFVRTTDPRDPAAPQRIVAMVGHLSDADLEGVQTLGIWIASTASMFREARR